MHYLLLTSSVMALMYITEGHIQVFQKPRFFGVKTGRTVMIYCVASNPSLPARVEWLKGGPTIESSNPLKTRDQRIIIMEKTSIRNASITIKNVNTDDSGIYFCKLNDTNGPGTELQVSRHSDPQSILKRSRIKDMLIILQGFLLTLCVIVPLVLLYKQEKKEDAIYDEPEVDHTYEGLEIDHCGDIYEDISTLAPAPGQDAVWEVESPDQE